MQTYTISDENKSLYYILEVNSHQKLFRTINMYLDVLILFYLAIKNENDNDHINQQYIWLHFNGTLNIVLFEEQRGVSHCKFKYLISV